MEYRVIAGGERMGCGTHSSIRTTSEGIEVEEERKQREGTSKGLYGPTTNGLASGS